MGAIRRSPQARRPSYVERGVRQSHSNEGSVKARFKQREEEFAESKCTPEERERRLQVLDGLLRIKSEREV